MINYQVVKGTTNLSVTIRIIDSTDGTPETGVVAATSGLVLQYRREAAANVSLATITNLAALTTAHTDKGILHIGNGYYRVDIPDAACATGVDGVLVHGIVTGMVVIGCYIQLTDIDIMDGVRGGMTALPNAAANAAGGLPISVGGGLALDTKLAATNEITAARMGALTDWINGGRLDAILDIIAADTTTDIPALIGTPSDFGSGTSTIAANLQDMADNGTAAFDRSTDSLQAVRDRGDAAWTTGAGGSDRLLLADTTIATLASQTSFTLTAGSADDDAYNNCTIVIEDVSTAVQKSIGMVLDYVGSSKTVTLKEALTFTIATTDKVYILAENSLKSTVANRQLDVTANGAAGIDWGNVENPTTANDLSATDIQLVDTVTTYTGNTLQTGDVITAINDLANATDGLTALKALLDAIPTTMRGTDNAALASVVGALNDAAAAGDPTTADTLVQYIKQLINVLVGSAGVGTYPAAAAPGDAVSLAEIIRSIYDDSNELQDDWVDGGRLDLILDAMDADTGVVLGIVSSLPDSGGLTTIQADLDDIQTRIPAALSSGNMKADMLAISTSAAAADELEQNILDTLGGTASGTPTTTAMVSDIGVTVDDQFKGRVIVFNRNTTTAALRNQATDITGCTASSNTLTFTALTTAPVSGDTFRIL